ncbi:hypothetical protein H4Q26_017299 [Puccinia striiformis f. sp. tritici PST-130]|nr:hypothetical protein H4Q26_017299 [Puccinia striiformis f. sp. tritici PST-130]
MAPPLPPLPPGPPPNPPIPVRARIREIDAFDYKAAIETKGLETVPKLTSKNYRDWQSRISYFLKSRKIYDVCTIEQEDPPIAILAKHDAATARSLGSKPSGSNSNSSTALASNAGYKQNDQTKDQLLLRILNTTVTEREEYLANKKEKA